MIWWRRTELPIEPRQARAAAVAVQWKLQRVGRGDWSRSSRLAPMSEAESPERAASAHHASVEDVRQLMGASTPHFALQLAARIEKLIAGLPPEDPARALGEQELRRLEELAVDGENRGIGAQPGQRPLASLRD